MGIAMQIGNRKEVAVCGCQMSDLAEADKGRGLACETDEEKAEEKKCQLALISWRLFESDQSEIFVNKRRAH